MITVVDVRLRDRMDRFAYRPIPVLGEYVLICMDMPQEAAVSRKVVDVRSYFVPIDR